MTPEAGLLYKGLVKVIIDIEANSLRNPTQIWLIVCQDIETDKIYIFRNVTSDEEEKKKFLEFCKGVSLYIGHNLLEYDMPNCSRLLGNMEYSADNCCDTLILSRLINYSRTGGHSLEAYGEEFGLPKIKFNDWTKWSQEMEDYCVQDVRINHQLYLHFRKYWSSPDWARAIRLEQSFQLVVNSLADSGFAFNRSRAESLLRNVEAELKLIDDRFSEVFPPKEILIREFTPKLTKFGTISRTSVPRTLHPNIHTFEAGKTYRHTRLEPFNPSSHKQLIDVLTEAGWKPTEKTATHIELERELSRQKWAKEKLNELDFQAQCDKLNKLKKYGWKINEDNLATLPAKAPAPARSLAKRILLESRRRTLTEWLGLVQDDGRIHGKFLGIGTWTHRMATQKPNMQNIPNEFDEQQRVKYLGKELRQLWQAPRNRLLVGVDAEGIQLRLLAHYIDEAEFTHALVHGKKSDKTDPHSLNQRIIGNVCKSRQAAKRFIYALILGAGLGKLAEILECSEHEAEQALDRIMERYQGWASLKRDIFPVDARRGYIIGLDGRKVVLPGDTPGERRHLAMSAYLQNGEAIVIKHAAIKFNDRLGEIDNKARLINIVHDEYVIECGNSLDKAKKIKRLVCDSIEETGRDLKLLCPLSGEGDVGLTWYDIH